MRRCLLALLLISGLTLIARPAKAQADRVPLRHWHTAGAGLSTPLGFNVGASYSLRLTGPVFAQVGATASKDLYVTQHSALAVGPALGLRLDGEAAVVTLAAGPTYLRGARGLDLTAPGASYEAAALTVTGQILFTEVNMGFELFSHMNGVRAVSGMRLLYRLGRIR